MNIKEIGRVVYLLQKANNQCYAYVSEIAKEMKVKKTDLTEFILNNPKLFVVVNDKKGMGVKECYESESSNPYNPEYLERQKREWARKLYVCQWDCYGQKEDYYLTVDANHYSYNDKKYSDMVDKWRNTNDKIKEVEKSGHFFKGMGSTGMFSGTEIPYCLSVQNMKDLIDEGWTLVGEIPDVIKEYQYKDENKGSKIS